MRIDHHEGAMYVELLDSRRQVSDRGIDTEIDWEAYMQQVQQYLAGERDYVKIAGGTGPLVYPAAHVYIYSALYWITDKGKDIRLAQVIFAGLYLSTIALVMLCYRLAKVRSPFP